MQHISKSKLQNQFSINYIELPTTQLTTWKTLLSHIRFKIECINITTIDLSIWCRLSEKNNSEKHFQRKRLREKYNSEKNFQRK